MFELEFLSKNYILTNTLDYDDCDWKEPEIRHQNGEGPWYLIAQVCKGWKTYKSYIHFMHKLTCIFIYCVYSPIQNESMCFVDQIKLEWLMCSMWDEYFCFLY